MRISDWSSDVCSSDLQAVAVTDGAAWHRSVDGGGMSSAGGRRRSLLANAIESIGTTPVPTPTADAPVADDITVREKPAEDTATRSEEHTSELQSLMRISYAVFCLKKKTIRKIKDT